MLIAAQPTPRLLFQLGEDGAKNGLLAFVMKDGFFSRLASMDKVMVYDDWAQLDAITGHGILFEEDQVERVCSYGRDTALWSRLRRPLRLSCRMHRRLISERVSRRVQPNLSEQSIDAVE